MSLTIHNTICPVCGGYVAPERPPMHLFEPPNAHEQHVPTLWVCSDACAQRVGDDPGVFYQASQRNVQAWRA